MKKGLMYKSGLRGEWSLNTGLTVILALVTLCIKGELALQRQILALLLLYYKINALLQSNEVHWFFFKYQFKNTQLKTLKFLFKVTSILINFLYN